MEKDYCPNCGIPTNHDVLYSAKTTSSSDDFGWHQNYEIIKCRGCDNIQFRTIYGDESMVGYNQETGEDGYYTESKYYPLNIVGHKRIANSHHMPEKIRIVYNESLEALKGNCYLLSAVGLRAVIEAICIDQSIPGRNLEQKINNLSKQKLITERDGKRLHSIRFLGNDSVHEMEVPQKFKIIIALDIIENLIKNLYIIDLIAKQHLDTIIDTYEDFKNFINKNTFNLKPGDEKSIQEILGKNIRRIENSYLSNFIQELIEDINNGIIPHLSIGKVTGSGESSMQYFIKK